MTSFEKITKGLCIVVNDDDDDGAWLVCFLHPNTGIKLHIFQGGKISKSYTVLTMT